MKHDEPNKSYTIKGEVRFNSHGVGKYRTKYLSFRTNNSEIIELPKKLITKFFPELPFGCEYRTKEATITIEVNQ